ncbi:AAA family ATPase, partial [Streptomyces sp. NPDC059873]
MIVWINGAFGAGKSSTARELIDLIPNCTLYEPELIGGTLAELLPQKRLAEVTDFQDLPIWRRLVVDTAAALLAEVGGALVVPMTLLRQEYRDEIFGGLASRRIPVRHVLLTTDETILRGRIAAREAQEAHGARESGGSRADDPGGHGAGGHGVGERVRRGGDAYIEPYHAALGWLTGDALVIDNSGLTARETAVCLAEAVRTGTAGLCEI